MLLLRDSIDCGLRIIFTVESYNEDRLLLLYTSIGARVVAVVENCSSIRLIIIEIYPNLFALVYTGTSYYMLYEVIDVDDGGMYFRSTPRWLASLSSFTFKSKANFSSSPRFYRNDFAKKISVFKCSMQIHAKKLRFQVSWNWYYDRRCRLIG